jgi:hypothetical protein
MPGDVCVGGMKDGFCNIHPGYVPLEKRMLSSRHHALAEPAKKTQQH